MDKKGAGWGTIIMIIIILISVVVILGLLTFFGKGISEIAEATKNKLLEAFKS